ncbi:MAG TPA: Type 1 glutamine amidotransferase-like domain-containing protein [Acidimicrobiales bacterium]|nr:Type 1 glutamine amidotransferase-like domain-containing protein [Acidimicrobiales bacterium]
MSADPPPVGPVALVGGGEWQEGCSFDAELLARAGGVMLVLPTGAAYQRPDRAVARAERWFAALGGTARPLPVLTRADAQDRATAATVAAGRGIYLAGGSPLHLRSVLKATPVWEAIRRAWLAGAVVAGSSAGAMVLTDPMVDPRGGALTLGLGLVEHLAVVPEFRGWDADQIHRTLALAAPGLPVVGIEERTALLREPDGTWRHLGAGQVSVVVDGGVGGLEDLPR